MRLDYIEPLVDSAIEVLSEFTGHPVERGDMKLRDRSCANMEVAAFIGMTGDVDGRIIIEMSSETALSMAGMMNKRPCSTLDEFALDTLMELANVVVARAVSTLNDEGFTFRLTPPTIVTGETLHLFDQLNLEALIIPLYSDAGDLNLNVALRMNTL